MKNKRILMVVTAVLLSGVIETADAIIGRPLTPMSYAGVARRTVRRSAYYGHGYYYYGYGTIPTNKSIKISDTYSKTGRR